MIKSTMTEFYEKDSSRHGHGFGVKRFVGHFNFILKEIFMTYPEGCTANFVFHGLKDEKASVGLFVSDSEAHDFLMDKEDVESNIVKFGPHPELIAATKALAQQRF
ncbi:MAG: hypothetical protein HGB26_00455 [Desulfobulbaceae bacterium]|nr:hypothetical protein [Desulfobulbaceae bacterium]